MVGGKPKSQELSSVRCKINDIGTLIKDNPYRYLGEHVASGSNVDCFRYLYDERFVIKLAKKSKDIDWIAHHRRHAMRELCLVEKQIIAPTYYSENGVYYEVQPFYPQTLLFIINKFLHEGNIHLAKSIILKTFDYEEHFFWRRGLVIHDAGSFFSNFAYQDTKLTLFDFDSLDSDPSLNLLFFEGPWRLFRISGTLSRFELSSDEGDLYSNFKDWYTNTALGHYNKKKFLATNR